MNINKLCKDVPPEIRPEIRTLAKAVIALRDKVEELIPVYIQSPLAQTDNNAKREGAESSSGVPIGGPRICSGPRQSVRSDNAVGTSQRGASQARAE